MSVPKLYTIICATRSARHGDKFAKWFNDFAAANSDFDAELIDLAEVKLPFFDESTHPRAQKYEHEHTKKWSKLIDAGDAFVFVIPEYNYSPPAEFFNAVNYLNTEWNYKPAAIMSYGGVSGGLRSAQVARSHLSTLRMVPLPEGIPLPNYPQFLNENGAFVATEMVEASAKTVLSELKVWNDGLQTIRNK
ncbi:NAD(P)H-dependent oxidoreductase [Pseudochrobactrum sp. sp1633]|nr:NAD(P)H-dependent oxidoreductase [Pseudochrobactrum sp. sp1633]MDM8343812.1 NAD(P)H-dependent oxidoreductase [Pseudochrobactrum sp. sp1633]HWD11796.1 NAD(P)H-dependent oxidoreductase [Pseudochrobactrum sp.]